MTAAVVAALAAVDPAGLGGVGLRSPPGPARDAWLAHLRGLLPEGTPWRRVPLHVGADRLLGGLDLAATLQTGRPVAQRGLLAEADGGVLLLAMAERLEPSTAAYIAAALDTGEETAERHGLAIRSPSRVCVVALDEGIGADEGLPERLLERLAFHLDLEAAGPPGPAAYARADIAAARGRFACVRIDEEIMRGLCAASLALGIDSARACLFACRAARVAAALEGRDRVEAPDAALAAALVLAPRATRVPAPAAPEPDEGDPPPPEPPPPRDASEPDTSDAPSDPAQAPRASGPVEDVLLEAALAALPPGLLALLALSEGGPRRPPSGAGAGATRMSRRGGRPCGARRRPAPGARLNLVETLRAAAPWQALRRREAGDTGRVQIRREDVHVWRFKQRNETTTVFVVDASGSAALTRLAETKGAVELLLADCYVRRDSVAVVAFRGPGAQVLLPPTRSLVRAKRSLAGLPGGGGTPLAAGIDAARALGDSIRRRGATPVIVILTDGRANIARDGSPGRARATDDALASARGLRAEGFAALLLDTATQPQEAARTLAAAMGARYLPLPHANASLLSQAVRAAA